MATANSNYSNQHKMLQQQQQEHQATTGTDNDEAATNCSETMSTANEEEAEECFGHSQQPLIQSVSPTSGLDCFNALAQMDTGGALTDCGDIQQSDNNLDNGREGACSRNANEDAAATDHHLASSPQETDGGCSLGPSELSAGSGAQAPPSYGTATRVCATLDAGQLRNSLGLANQVQLHLLQQQQQQPPPQQHNPPSGDAFRFTSAAGQHYSLAHLVGGGGDPTQQQQQQQQHPVAAANYSNPVAGGPQLASQPLFNGLPIESYRPSVSLTMRVPRTQSFEAHSARAATRAQQPLQQMNDSPHLSGSLPRSSFAMVPHSNGLSFNNVDAHYARPAASFGQYLNNPRPDNNQGSEFSWHKLQQQQQVANLKLAAPINHVISAHGSLQWQPQANQYYAPGSLAANTGAPTMARPHLQQHQQQQTEHLARSSLKSARIMDAPFPWPTTAATAHLHLQQQQQQPALASNQNDSPSTSCWLGHPASISGTTTNVGAAAAAAVTQQPQEPLDNQGDARKNNQRTFAVGLQQAQQHNNNNPKALVSNKGSPSRRSDENLERSSRRHQQQQAHRKRRRHRSTSGRSVSPETAGRAASGRDEEATGRRPATGLGTPTTYSAGQQQQHQKGVASGRHTISAHCWLIDSSDDQTYGASVGGQSRTQSGSAVNLPKRSTLVDHSDGLLQKAIPQPPRTHLTVAMMRQTLEQQRQLKQDSGEANQVPRSSSQYLSSKSLASPGQAMPKQQGIATVSEDVDLTVSLRTNSLRMERILNRDNGESGNNGLAWHTLATTTTAAGSGTGRRSAGRATSGRRQHPKQRRRRSSSSSQSSPVSCSSLSGHCHSAPTHSGNRASSTTARLTILLSFMANLVRGRPRGSGMRPPVAPAIESALPGDDGDSYYPAAPANSMTGASVALKKSQSLAPYTTAGSLAISSSSSTSAYATESSHLSSSQTNSTTNPPRSVLPIVTDRRVSLALLKGHHHHLSHIPPPSNASTTGSSLFYSSSGNSGIQMSTTSSGTHGYEYCDDDRINETKFVQQARINEEQKVEASSQSSQSTGDSRQDDDDDEDEDNPNGPSAGAAREGNAKRPHHGLLSDNELLSAGSEAGFQPTSGRGQLPNTATASLAAVVSQATPSVARRRWWWMSLKDILCRRPCSGAAGSGGSSGDSEEGGTIGQPAQRYKSLRSRRKDSSTLKNVLSLAKADKVFRTRLLASLLVSCILLGLIGLLCGLIYSRSSSLYQRNRLGLLIDDSDYDLSWLWPYDPPLNQQQPQQATPSTRYRILDLQLARNPAELLMMDGTLRDPLLMIEQSERLAQYQQTMGHLTNLQLANDNFVDLTQLASRLKPLSDPDNEPLPPPAASSPSNTSSGGGNSHPRGSKKLQLSDHDRDLISLTLLSNLHWPLVKWRHQNQQSVANFLAFALPHTGTVQPHLRSLLSILLLAEAGTELPLAASNNSNLIQFARLSSLLRTSSYHITSCSFQLLDESSTNKQPDGRKSGSLRMRFCDLLVTRYKRMMLTLSRLNHSHLVKLRDSMEPTPSMMEVQMGQQDYAGQQQAQLASSRTLLSFFLDRLALLDVQLLAESTLAMADPEELEENFASEQDEEESSTSGMDWESRALASILDYELSDPNNLKPTNNNNNNKWQQSGTLMELAKLIIGDGPSRLNVDLEHSEWGSHLQHLEVENSDAWRELLLKDLLYPWPSHRLPHFLAPHNYDLFLHPNLTTRLLLGMVKIGFQLPDRPTRFIVLHCDKLNLLDVSLWLKQEPQTQSYVNRSLNGGTSGGETLHRIPIRRVLRNAKLEQIYIELQSPIRPSRLASDHFRSSSSGQFSHGSGSIIFGGELPLQEVARSQDSHFILSISYNKTSLMQPQSPDLPVEHGLEFVQYTDYFAQTEAEVKTMLYTQFEPQNSRRLFPSLDEPHLKARFQLNIVHEQSHQVLFNAPKRERVPYSADGSHQMSVFETTPIPLSTYLVAFVVCDTQNIKSLTSRVAQLQVSPSHGLQKLEPKHIQVQVLAQFEQLGQAEFASQLVPQLLAFYQTYLNFPYPLDKLDLVAIPRAMPAATTTTVQTTTSGGGWTNQQLDQTSISSGGGSSSQQGLNTMENMGLIWFKANLLLVDTNLISQNLIEQVGMIISHQLAHQYFGNIVGISHWDDLWLYESLCQYLESVALSNVQSDWRLDEQFPVTSIQETLTLEQFNWLAPDSGQHTQSSMAANHQPASSKASSEQLNMESLSDGSNLELEASDLSDGQSLPDSGGLDQLVQDESYSRGQSTTFDSFGGFRGASELRRGSAILHMLLFNLLPSQEARGRLLRRCLSLFRYGTMSRVQFWHQFGEQLAQEGSSERLALSLDGPQTKSIILTPMDQIANDQVSSQSESWHNSTAERLSGTYLPTERVVFVRPSPSSGRKFKVQGESGSASDAHKVHVRSADRLSQNLELAMDAWLDRRGYPLITASSSRDRIQLRQERFSFAWWNEPGLIDEELPLESLMGDKDLPESNRNQRLVAGQHHEPINDDPVWPIPLMMVSRFNQKQARFLWMDKREIDIPLQWESLYSVGGSSLQDLHSDSFQGSHNLDSRKGHSGTWFKLNVNQSSIVRVNYDERNWEALTDLMLKSHYSNHLLSPLDRANLIDDSLTLMRCGKLSVGVAMNLTLYLEVGEREYMPWTSALRHLDQMQTLLNQNPLWHRYVLKLMQPISSVIGWKDDGPHLMRKLRKSLFGVALQYGDEKTVNKAKQEFKGWFKSGRFIVPNLQELVYVAGVRYGDQQEWFHCWQKYTQLVSLDLGASSLNQTDSLSLDNGNSLPKEHGKSNHLLSNVASPIGSMIDSNEPNSDNEKRQLLTALASTHNTWLLEQFLNYSLDSTKIQPYHLKHVMQTLGKNPVARLYLWRFVRLNWNSLIDRYVDNLNDSPNFSRAVGEDRPKSYNNGDSQDILATMIMESTKHFVTKLDYEEVKTFFESKRKQHKQRTDSYGWSPKLERAIQQSLQVIRANIYWRNYVEPKLTKWLSHYDSSAIN